MKLVGIIPLKLFGKDETKIKRPRYQYIAIL
jgi:hypothetical protein